MSRVANRFRNTTEGAVQWWRQRAPREQWMVACMCVLLAAFAYWYAMMVPLFQLRDAMQARYDRAATTLLDARSQQRQQSSLQTAASMLSQAALLQSARRAGIAVTAQRMDENHRLRLDIQSVPAGVLLGWLQQLRQQHGMMPLALDLQRSNGQLQARVEFVVAAETAP